MMTTTVTAVSQAKDRPLSGGAMNLTHGCALQNLFLRLACTYRYVCFRDVPLQPIPKLDLIPSPQDFKDKEVFRCRIVECDRD